MEGLEKQHARMGGQLWDSRPVVEGLSKEEIEDVARGNIETVVSGIKAISNSQERDKRIQTIITSIGSRLKELDTDRDIIETETEIAGGTEEQIDMTPYEETMERELKNPGKIAEYRRSMERLEKLYSEMLKLHQGE
jgi:hypothetical protein